MIVINISYLVEDDLVQLRMRLDDLETELWELIDVFNGMVNDEEDNVEFADFLFV